MAILVIFVESLVYWKNSKVYYNRDESIHKIVLSFMEKPHSFQMELEVVKNLNFWALFNLKLSEKKS